MNDIAHINDPVSLGETAVQSYLRGTKKLQRYIEPMALGLAAAKGRHPQTSDFKEWLANSPYGGLEKNERAALIRLGESWSDELREWIAGLTISSPRLIWEKHCETSQNGNSDNVTDDDEDEDDESGYYGSERRVRSNEAWDTVDPRLVTALVEALPNLRKRKIWEPAAGRGLMVDQLREEGCTVECASDIEPRGARVEGQDFLAVTEMPLYLDAIVTNPPWGRLAAPFIRHALDLARPVRALVAMLVPVPWLTSAGVADMTGDTGLEVIVIPRFRAKWMTAEEEAELANGPASPKMNHIWVIWDFARDGSLLPAVVFVDRPAVQEATTLLAAE